jgi:sugar/nucleoside kinase (ribokinase family)
MTPKLRLDHEALAETPLLWSRSFHLICSPLRCIDLVENILRLRKEASNERSNSRPLFIWEPVPDVCTPAEYENCLKALRHVDVISPNNNELGGFFGKSTDEKEHVNYRLIESLCDQWLQSGIGPDSNGGVVVRCGKDGCIVVRKGVRSWMPAYHQSAEKVVDPTGGGNGFLGGLAVGLVRGGSAPGENRWKGRDVEWCESRRTARRVQEKDSIDMYSRNGIVFRKPQCSSATQSVCLS